MATPINSLWAGNPMPAGTPPARKLSRRIRMNIKGSVVLLTGANGGIGRALTHELLSRGAAKIYLAARDVSLARTPAGRV